MALFFIYIIRERYLKDNLKSEISILEKSNKTMYNLNI